MKTDTHHRQQHGEGTDSPSHTQLDPPSAHAQPGRSGRKKEKKKTSTTPDGSDGACIFNPTIDGADSYVLQSIYKNCVEVIKTLLAWVYIRPCDLELCDAELILYHDA